MQALPIVIDFDVLKHLVFGDLPGDKAFTVDGLDLEAVIPALHGGIVVAVALLAHTAHQAVFQQQLLIVAGAVLAATVGVDDAPARPLAVPQRHL